MTGRQILEHVLDVLLWLGVFATAAGAEGIVTLMGL